MPDKTEGNSRGGEGKAPVTTGSPEGRGGCKILRVELGSKSDD